MLYLKKYFTEGLIQMAILLSLCGVRLDVGLEPYLPPSWHEMILGPTSALTQTQFHNLRNHLEVGQDLHPKSVDLDGFFTARRLLGWVRSLDRLQVPNAELETWLVQREPDPLPVRCPEQPSPLERAPVGVERDRTALPVEPRAGLGNLEEEEEEEEEDKEEGTHHVLHHSGGLDDRREDEQEEEEEEDMARIQQHRNTERGGRPGGSNGNSNNRELAENEANQTSFSLQECLRLLEETFPFTEEQELCDVGERGELDCQPSHREPLLSPIIPTDNPSLDLELHWQDLLAIMEPENTDVDIMTSFDHILGSRPSGTFQGVGSEDLPPNSNNPDNVETEADQEVLFMETPLQHGLLGPHSQSTLQPALLPLRPSAELDDSSPALNTSDTLKNQKVDPLDTPSDHMDLLAKDPSEGLRLNADDNSSTFNMYLITQDVVDRMEPETPPGFDVSFHSCELTPSSFRQSLEGNCTTQDLVSPSNVFLVDEEDVDDEDGLPSPLGDLLEDATILDEIRLLDLALEEGFSPEMAARLEEEGYIDRDILQEETGRDDDSFDSNMDVTEDQGQPGRHFQDGEVEADSDSGLSLDFSHSPASPCVSEASSYSSSSSSSTSSSSCMSTVGSTFSKDKNKDADEGLDGSDMEVIIKQEELEEEEMGAVGGGYPGDAKKLLPSNYGDHKLFNGFPWLEHIDHDHTYNQPWSFVSSPSLGKIPTKHTKSAQRRDNSKPYRQSSSRHIPENKMWSRDERRARTLKIPFSNEVIVNLPVEEFNDLLTNYQLNEEQLALVRDIRRRGKNKIAAQNCRKRKLDVLVGLEDDVSGLRRQRSRLHREKQEALKNLQEMKRRLGMLYQEVFSRLRDEEGRPLDATDYMLRFGPTGSVTVSSCQQGARLPLTGEKNSRKQRDKKK